MKHLILFLFNLILIVCKAQEHLTCLRTDEPGSSALNRTHQGPPGKRGPIGLKGETGSKGNKGDPGIPNNSPINALREEIQQLRQQVTALKTANTRGYKRLAHGWVTIFNGYQYKKTPRRQSWDASRSICRSWGGDLAVYGVQDMGSRRLIIRLLSIINFDIWIGLNDKATEGSWVWVNRERAAVPVAVLWIHNQPDNHRNNEDCGEIISSTFDGYGTNDEPCSRNNVALCEKTYSA